MELSHIFSLFFEKVFSWCMGVALASPGISVYWKKYFDDTSK